MATPRILPTHLSVPQAAKRLRCGRTAIYAAIEAGHLPAVRIGRGTRKRHYRIPPEALTGYRRATAAPSCPVGTAEYAEVGVG